jgi:hypothetical protein
MRKEAYVVASHADVQWFKTGGTLNNLENIRSAFIDDDQQKR